MKDGPCADWRRGRIAGQNSTSSTGFDPQETFAADDRTAGLDVELTLRSALCMSQLGSRNRPEVAAICAEQTAGVGVGQPVKIADCGLCGWEG
jgi:hypothetical protein